MTKYIFAVLIAIVLTAGTTFAQGSAVRSAAQGKQGDNAAIPLQASGKVAVIDSRAFPEGIGEMKKQLDKLETEFQPRTKELEGLQNQLLKLDEELKVGGSNMKPEVLRDKTTQMGDLKKEFDRKREDYQADLQKRSEVAIGPVQDKIRKFLEGYSAAREIVIVFDLAPIAQAGLVFLNPATNVTDDFIKEYNKANPSPSAPPQP